MRTNSNHQTHLANLFEKKAVDYREDLDPKESLSECQLDIMCHFNRLYQALNTMLPMTDEARLVIMKVEQNYREFIHEVIANLRVYLNNNNEDKTLQTKFTKIEQQIRIWMFNMAGLSALLCNRKDHPESFLIAKMARQELKNLSSIIDSLSPNLRKLLAKSTRLIPNKFYDFDQCIGDYYLAIKDYQRAAKFHLEAMENLTESSDSKDWLNNLRGGEYCQLALCNLNLNDLPLAYFYLYKSNLSIIAKDIAVTDINHLDEELIKVFPNQYYLVLNQFIDKLFEFPDNEIFNKEKEQFILNTVNSLLPKEKNNPELYYSIYAKVIGILLKKKNYTETVEILLPKLADSKIKKFETYGKNCQTFLVKKNWKKIIEALSDVKSPHYEVLLDNDKQQVKIKILNPALTKKKFINLENSNYKINTATIVLNCATFADKKSAAQISEILNYLENYQESLTSEAQIFKPENREAPANNSKGINLTIENNNNNAIKNSKKVSNEPALTKAEEKSLSEAEKLGFSNKYSHVNIYSIGRNAHFPDGVYFGFFTSSGKLEKETEDKFIKVLDNGRISTKCPAIKPVAKDTFKLAPFDDHRIISVVEERTNHNGKNRILLNFKDENIYNHTEQKKLYK